MQKGLLALRILARRDSYALEIANLTQSAVLILDAVFLIPGRCLDDPGNGGNHEVVDATASVPV